MTRNEHEESVREKLYGAALSVAVERGFGHVTIDAVAKRAGVSKGGLLYYFPSKTHLIKALLDHCLETVQNENPSPSLPGLNGIGPLPLAMLIAAAEDPTLLDLVAKRWGMAGAADTNLDAIQRWRVLMAGFVREPCGPVIERSENKWLAS